jgi:hypothetical protein
MANRNATVLRTLLTAAIAVTALAGGTDVAPLRTPLALKDVDAKCFYFLTMLREVPAVRAAVAGDPALDHLGAAMRQAIAAAAVAKPASAAEVVRAGRWSDVQIEQAGQQLCKALGKDPAVRDDLVRRLRQSGVFVRESNLSDDALIAHAWSAEAAGMNHVLDVYCDGKPPAYPKIDSMSADPRSPEWAAAATGSAEKAAAEKSGDLFFEAPLRLATAVLEANHRDEAGRFEPMADGENQAAIKQAGSTDWGKFEYSCILVPGLGPEAADEPLSPGGRARAELAAERFKAGKAPFILVSGGNVHPNQTRYNEAVEMRRELVGRLGIPADAVLIDPHARHTTTNFRDAARLIYRYGMPTDKPMLVTSDAAQIGSIASKAFAVRCVRELGYEPAKIGRRVSLKEVEARPNMESLEEDPMAPLDP